MASDERERLLAAYRIVTLTDDPDRIREFLLTDRFFADYARGDLDPEHFQFTMWLGAEKDDELRTVVMTYHDLEPPIFCAIGEAGGIEAILDRVLWLERISLSIREEHVPAVERFYRTELVPMLKMALLPEDFRPVNQASWQEACRSAKPASLVKLVQAGIAQLNRRRATRAPLTLMKLEVSHISLLEALYSYGGGDAFRQRSLEQGVFYGVFEGERLVSVAGTHIVSDQECIAALGNVMTHPDYRGRGLATMATSAVCEELLGRGIELIGLSVSRSNEAAIRVYEKIGFKRRFPFYEGTAVRKDDHEFAKE